MTTTRSSHSSRRVAAAAVALFAVSSFAANLPLNFEPGGSRTAPFFARGEGFTAYFGLSRVTVATPAGAYALVFRGANPTLWLVTEEDEMGETDRSQLRYARLYPGIDLIFHGRLDTLEHDFVVKPEASPSLIELEFEGASLTVEPDGSITLARRGERLVRHRPCFYQERAGARMEVTGRYVRSGVNRVRFAVGRYDRSLPLIIN
jgi:hypothetical protein